MEKLKNFLSTINIVAECKKYRVPIMRCPTFLFVMMGILVIIAILASYLISQLYSTDPEVQALLALVVAAITFSIGHFVVQSFAEMAELSLLKSQFLNIISHQLLTPMSSLKWALSLLNADNMNLTDAEKKEMTTIISQSNEKMINIVNSLLDVSRLDVGKISLHLEEADIVDITNNVIEKRKIEAESKGNVIKFEHGVDIPVIRTDIARLRVVIDNLIENAIKFSNPGTDIIVRIFPEGINKIMFSVEDFGIGISKSQRRHIYNKFFKAERVQYQTKGFGLGLFTAKFLMDALGGEIDFKSEEGVGSMFWFKLPVKSKLLNKKV